MQKFFGFLKSTIDFIRIIIMFSVLMLLLQWIEHLTNSQWAWLNFIRPVLNFFLAIGELISKESVNVAGALFEYKYGIAVIIMFLLHFCANGLTSLIETAEDKCDDVRRIINKNAENSYNKKLYNEHAALQKKINKYCISVHTSLKKKFSHEELGYNIDEQNKIMNKFLMEKTGISPTFFEGGFLYQFDYFDEIDKILDYFFKLIKSDLPLNYSICVQIEDGNKENAYNQIKQLVSLKLENKIVMLSDTVFRYKYKSAHRYGTSQVGLFQKGDSTIEVHEFVEI